MIYLILAVTWFLAGVFLLIADWWFPGFHPYRVPGTDLSPGWLALLLSVYNVVRYWARQSAVRRQNLPTERWRQRRRSGEEPPLAPDPNFHFTDEPADAERKRPDD